MKQISFLLFSFSLLCMNLSFADKIHLKNGEVLIGKATDTKSYWVVETSSGILKIKKIRVAWVEKGEIALPKNEQESKKLITPNKKRAKDLKILKNLSPGRKFKEKYMGNEFRGPAPYYYGPSPYNTYYEYYSGVSGPGYFFGTLNPSPYYFHRPVHSYSPSYYGGLHYHYRYTNKNFGIVGGNAGFRGSYRTGNSTFRFRFTP